jgi:hypothetical protein
MKRAVAAATAALLMTGAAHADNDGCAIIRPNSDGWAAVRSGPGTQYHLTRKLLPGRSRLPRTQGGQLALHQHRCDQEWHDGNG